MSEIPSKNYTHSSLNVNANEVNPWLIANVYYADCIDRFLNRFPSKQDALNELGRADVNNICKRELGYLRDLAPTIRYKEVLGGQSTLIPSPFIEESEISNRK